MKAKTILIVFLVVITLSSCSSKQNISPAIPLPASTFAPSTQSSTISETPRLLLSTSYRIIPGANSENIITLKTPSNVTLKNLMVKICIAQIDNNWRQDIQDITSFVIESNASASGFTQEYQYDDICFSIKKGGNVNEALLRFEALPASQNIDITIKKKSPLSKPEKNYEGKVYIKIPAKLFSGETNDGIIVGNTINLFGESLVYFFAEKWAPAHLYVQIKCDNCVDNWKSYGYSLFKERSVIGCEIPSKDTSFIRMSCTFLFTYYATDLFSLLPEKETTYFLANRNPDNESSIEAITKEQYESNSP